MGEVYFDYQHHEFSLTTAGDSTDEIHEKTESPLSVIVQVTRRCNLHCSFCSESEQFKDPSFNNLIKLRDKLTGIKRIYLSGGEPLLRKDIFDLLQGYREKFPVVGLPTNSTLLTKEVSKKLKNKVNYVNAGLDGPRKINNMVRGGYDEIIKGIANLQDAGIEVSLSTVILKSTLPYLQFVVQIADLLGVVKVKMVIPVPRGRAKNLRSDDYVPKDKILAKFKEIESLKNTLGWKPRVKFTFWDEKTEGYALLIYPNQKVYAWPVFNAPESVLYLGDLTAETIYDVWERYPYKANHINKYTGISMYKA